MKFYLKDKMENSNNNNNSNNSTNSLPEYKIRTMESDIDKLERGLNLPPEELPIVVTPKPVEVPPVPKPVKVSVPIEVSVPKIEPKKSPLPEIEDFIVPTPPPQSKIVPPAGGIPTGVGKELKKDLKIKQLKTENIFDSEIKTDRKNSLLIVLGVILLAVVILGFFYWRGLKAEPVPVPTPIDNGLQIPKSSISVENTKILKIENNISLLILLEDELKIEPLKTFRRIVPIKNSPTDGKEEVLSLSDLVKELNISIYPYVLSEFKNNYTLVLYGQEENEKRFGLIIETNNSNNLKEQLRFWEKTMVENLYNLFLGKQPTIPANKNFVDSEYNRVSIRFINFPNPDVSIDYAVLNNLFILSTSKESIRAIIDRIAL